LGPLTGLGSLHAEGTPPKPFGSPRILATTASLRNAITQEPQEAKVLTETVRYCLAIVTTRACLRMRSVTRVIIA